MKRIFKNRFLWAGLFFITVIIVNSLIAQTGSDIEDEYKYDDNSVQSNTEEEKVNVEKPADVVKTADEEKKPVEESKKPVEQAKSVKEEIPVKQIESLPEPVVKEPENAKSVISQEQQPQKKGELLKESETDKEEKIFQYDSEYIYVPDKKIKDEEKKSLVQNAVMEGIQLTSEPGVKTDESIITCYFIFRDRPTSYFYQTNPKHKTITFEFNDVELGTSPIPSTSQPPILGYTINHEMVDANKEIVGLNPEWHDVVRVVINLDRVPKIAVKDEYSVINFSFTWSTDIKTQDTLVEKLPVSMTKKVLIGAGGVAAIGAGIGIYMLVKKPDGDTKSENNDLNANDLPVHPVTEKK